MVEKTANNILADIKSLDPNKITEEDLVNFSKELSSLRVNKLGNRIQELRNTLKGFDVNSLTITDRDFVLDDINKLISELNSFYVTHE